MPRRKSGYVGAGERNKKVQDAKNGLDTIKLFTISKFIAEKCPFAVDKSNQK